RCLPPAPPLDHARAAQDTPEAAPRRSTKTLNRAPRRSTMFSMSDAPRPLTQLDEEQLLFRDAVLGFARERIAPLVHDMDATATLDRSLLPELFRLGVMGIEIPEEYGGSGSSFFNAVLAVEALATVDASVSVLVDVQNTLVANALLRWGNEGQKRRYLPRLASEWVGSYALSEASSGSDAFALKARAEKKGDRWIFDGRKLWITNSAESSLFSVFANADPSQGYRGITAFLV